MYKLLTFDSIEEDRKTIDLINPSVFEKTASEYSGEVQKFIDEFDFDTDKFLYLLASGLGAGEFWASNKNGDYFPEEALLGVQDELESLKNPGNAMGKQFPRYKTFLNGNIFKHHVNKDPMLSYGNILESIYNNDMKRVELIVAIDKSKAPDVVRNYEERGMLPAWSMGCKVPYDICSICGNQAKTRRQYCRHLLYDMNRIMSDGELVCAINTKPRFFDFSIVQRPAWRPGLTLAKVASDESDRRSFFMGSNELAEVCGYEKVSEDKGAEDKKAAITKKVQGELVPVDPKLMAKKTPESEEEAKLLGRTDPYIEDDDIKKLSGFELGDVMSTLLSSGIFPRPSEFQKIVLIRSGRPELADELHKRRIVFDPNEDYGKVDYPILGNFNNDIFSIIKRYVPQRTLFNPCVRKRIIMIKTGSLRDKERRMGYFGTPADYTRMNKNPATSARNFAKVLAPVGALYALLALKYPEFLKSALGPAGAKTIGNPLVAAALGLSAVGAYGLMSGLSSNSGGNSVALDYIPRQYSRNEKTASVAKVAPLVGIPLGTYAMSEMYRDKYMRGQKQGLIKKTVGAYPGHVATGLTGGYLATLGKNPERIRKAIGLARKLIRR
jgi:hypothetical protein